VSSAAPPLLVPRTSAHPTAASASTQPLFDTSDVSGNVRDKNTHKNSPLSPPSLRAFVSIAFSPSRHHAAAPRPGAPRGGRPEARRPARAKGDRFFLSPLALRNREGVGGRAATGLRLRPPFAFLSLFLLVGSSPTLASADRQPPPRPRALDHRFSSPSRRRPKRGAINSLAGLGGRAPKRADGRRRPKGRRPVPWPGALSRRPP